MTIDNLNANVDNGAVDDVTSMHRLRERIKRFEKKKPSINPIFEGFTPENPRNPTIL